jgi:hypothetical protein
MYFDIIGDISDVEVIAKGQGIRDLARIRKKYGPGNWRKLKGRAAVRMEDGSIHQAEIHWYEAHGVGRKRFKIKQILE